ncbi:hypothetical protein GGR20_001226 [Devosia subaequoris]|uniref:DUF4424 domain-containing protein n=1 Tax=Devosia subaequoris TaxID=395930 RepID=A0A7W6IL63_9HYPH|nr:DUF4424 domain-containing protein [Devosia subaequoris]MBB4051590.1 hypothetical protein [Devosia subaequoris]MCP1209182.1 DUF4424 domain-containing protein [Devosia subaequoris]
MRACAATLLVLMTGPVFGNDTAAVLTTGGLEFVSHGEIAMESEELFISREEIRVVYRFRNDSDEDHQLLVAFPMPDIVPDHYSPVAFPMGPSDNLFEFRTLFDGEPVEAKLHEYAYAAGVDRTKFLQKLDIPLVSISQEAIDAIKELDAETIDDFLHLGLAAPDGFDAGSGWETHSWPNWIYRATYTWEATFPAGETVIVEHRYTPSVGGTTGVAFLSEPYDDGYDPAAEYRRKYCTDESFIAAVRKTLPDPDEPWGAPFTESWISYILTTGGNWAGGGIENFRLVIDKGSTDNLVSFCGEGVTKIGPTTFEMVKQNFWPQEELNILILERYEAQ